MVEHTFDFNVERCEGSPKFVLSPSAAKLRLLKKLRCTLRYEKNAWASGAVLVAGVDEVGRGSLFGPVVAAAVILERGIAFADCAIPSCCCRNARTACSAHSRTCRCLAVAAVMRRH